MRSGLVAKKGLPCRLHQAAPRAESQEPKAGSPVREWQDLRWRNVGPTRGGRVTAFSGVRGQTCTFYRGGTGGGMYKTENCGETWTAISDGQKFGWRGGAFPRPNAWVSGTLSNKVIIGRSRSNAIHS